MLRAIEGDIQREQGERMAEHMRCRQALMKLAYSCGTVEAVQALIARMPSSKNRAIVEKKPHQRNISIPGNLIIRTHLEQLTSRCTALHIHTQTHA